jgi:hypothetical protein
MWGIFRFTPPRNKSLNSFQNVEKLKELSWVWIKSRKPLVVFALLSKNDEKIIYSFRYYTHEDAADCVKYINGTRLDDRIIRTDWDVGFKDGRQYGRGKTGGQVRDEYRVDYDPGRGGYGKGDLLEKTEGNTWRDTLGAGNRSSYLYLMM